MADDEVVGKVSFDLNTKEIGDLRAEVVRSHRGRGVEERRLPSARPQFQPVVCSRLEGLAVKLAVCSPGRTTTVQAPLPSSVRPMIFQSCIMKVTAVCNLNCSYCYMFNLSDRTYTRMPARMSLEIIDSALVRIREYLESRGQRSFGITLHGGEPTLWPLRSFEHFFKGVSNLRKQQYNIEVNLQTNAFRKLDRELLSLCAAHDVSLGVSLDGPASYNDAVRKDHRGHGSYDRVMETIQDIIAQGFQHLLGGFLTVANPAIPPKEYLTWIQNLPVRRVDVLWPIQFNHRWPPWKAYQMEEEAYRRQPVVGSWLANLFEEWWRKDDPELYIRLFFDIIKVLNGSRLHIDSLVNETHDMIVINTDGSIEYSDYLRASGDGACGTSYSVTSNPLAELEIDPVFRYLLELGTHLPAECKTCSFRHPCGGGFLPGRMMPGERFPRYRSVLCHDQFHFFHRVHELLDLPLRGFPMSPFFDFPRTPALMDVASAA